MKMKNAFISYNRMTTNGVIATLEMGFIKT